MIGWIKSPIFRIEMFLLRNAPIFISSRIVLMAVSSVAAFLFILGFGIFLPVGYGIIPNIQSFFMVMTAIALCNLLVLIVIPRPFRAFPRFGFRETSMELIELVSIVACCALIAASPYLSTAILAKRISNIAKSEAVLRDINRIQIGISFLNTENRNMGYLFDFERSDNWGGGISTGPDRVFRGREDMIEGILSDDDAKKIYFGQDGNPSKAQLERAIRGMLITVRKYVKPSCKAEIDAELKESSIWWKNYSNYKTKTGKKKDAGATVVDGGWSVSILSYDCVRSEKVSEQTAQLLMAHDIYLTKPVYYRPGFMIFSAIMAVFVSTYIYLFCGLDSSSRMSGSIIGIGWISIVSLGILSMKASIISFVFGPIFVYTVVVVSFFILLFLIVVGGLGSVKEKSAESGFNILQAIAFPLSMSLVVIIYLFGSIIAGFHNADNVLSNYWSMARIVHGDGITVLDYTLMVMGLIAFVYLATLFRLRNFVLKITSRPPRS